MRASSKGAGFIVALSFADAPVEVALAPGEGGRDPGLDGHGPQRRRGDDRLQLRALEGVVVG